MALSRYDVLREAIAILDDRGLGDLTMRRLATRLDVRPSALYWHFASKQELLAGVADRLLARMAPATATAWDVRTRELCTHLRDALLAYRDGAEVVATSYAFALGAQAPYRALADALIDGGLTRQDAEAGASVLLHFVFGYTVNEQQHLQAASLGAIPGGEPDAVEGTERYTSAAFLRGVDLILDGVRSQHGTAPTDDAPRTSDEAR
ncbi:regulatory TetR family protein [Mumia flava]|uniref:Regulatory TetR family protein n=1 Tax=Mumia flava TaxID=1348852 RepID=A0A2M9BG52_9ACTN|nr:TetR/AcrR family transcriptional regulator C-terminal domain-containing protein [Mumia flava]PJJ56933.1 regulatory TetR family protein [Mumia flava]